MISVASTSANYILQPILLSKHKKSLEWLSATVLWKRELAFFQKLLDKYAKNFSSTDDKKIVDHFQSFITYYNGELVNSLSTKLRLHEKSLADMLETKNETKTEYFKEHDELIRQLESVNTQFAHTKEELFDFIEKVM